MKNKEIQEQRMRGYFIQATKEILKAEGLKGISVRNIADKAGYSYATLYNYFKDVNDLIFLCVEDFQDECEEFVRSNVGDNQDISKKFLSAVIAYAKYFVEYPGIFDLFFIERMSDFGGKQSIIDLIGTSFNRATDQYWNSLIAEKENEDVNLYSNQIKYALAGELLFYLNRRTPSNYNEFLELIETQTSLTIQNL